MIRALEFLQHASDGKTDQVTDVSTDIHAKIRAASSAMSVNDLNRAERHFATVLRHQPNNSSALLGLIDVVIKRDRLSDALSQCRDAETILPDNIGLLRTKARILQAMQRNIDSRDVLSTARELFPANTAILHARARVAVALGEFGVAETFMKNPNVSDEAVLLIKVKSNGHAIKKPEKLSQTIRRAAMGEWGLTVDDIQFLPRGKLTRTSSGKIRRLAIAQTYRDDQNSAHRELALRAGTTKD